MSITVALKPKTKTIESDKYIFDPATMIITNKETKDEFKTKKSGGFYANQNATDSAKEFMDSLIEKGVFEYKDPKQFIENKIRDYQPENEENSFPEPDFGEEEEGNTVEEDIITEKESTENEENLPQKVEVMPANTNVIDTEAGKLLDDALSSITDISNRSIDLAVTLDRIMQGSYYTQFGYSSMKDFMDDMLPISLRMAYNYLTVGQAIRVAEIDIIEAKNVGVTKLITISPRVIEDSEQKDELLKIANENTVDELKGLLKRQSGSKEKKARFILSVRYTEEEGEIVRDALNIAKAKTNTDDDGKAVLAIIGEWVLMQDSGDEINVEDFIKFAYNNFGIKLQEVTEEKREVQNIESENEVDSVIKDNDPFGDNDNPFDTQDDSEYEDPFIMP